MLNLRLLCAAFLAILVVAPASALADDFDVRAPGRVVAFGDVHGAYDDWVALLKEVGIVDVS